MHHVAFRWQSYEGVRSVGLEVDGTDLRELVRRVEERVTGDPGISGDYAPLALTPAAAVEHYAGGPATAMLSCHCRDVSCSSLLADVEVAPTSVTWQGFADPYEGWDLTGLGPFVFDRAQYEQALRSLAQDDEASAP